MCCTGGGNEISKKYKILLVNLIYLLFIIFYYFRIYIYYYITTYIKCVTITLQIKIYYTAAAYYIYSRLKGIEYSVYRYIRYCDYILDKIY